MQRTIIAVFDNRGDAQSAFYALEAAGFPRAQIRLSEGDHTGSTSTVGGEPKLSPHEGAGILDSIRFFFGNMFGTDDSEHVQKYSDAVTRGHHVLTLTAATEPDIERAADIVERWGPVDIDEKVAEWSGAPLAGEAMRGAADMTDAAPAAGQRSGIKVVEHQAETTLNETEAAIEADEEYYLGHYHSTYAAGGQYDDYAPAYKYGANMANSETYRGTAWHDVEPQLRADWEGHYPGSAWEKFKAAVRHGWDKITPESYPEG